MTLGEHTFQLLGRTKNWSYLTLPTHVKSINLFDRICLDQRIDHYVSYLDWPFDIWGSYTIDTRGYWNISPLRTSKVVILE